jgi:hypothetical protein
MRCQCGRHDLPDRDWSQEVVADRHGEDMRLCRDYWRGRAEALAEIAKAARRLLHERIGSGAATEDSIWCEVDIVFAVAAHERLKEAKG